MEALLVLVLARTQYEAARWEILSARPYILMLFSLIFVVPSFFDYFFDVA